MSEKRSMSVKKTMSVQDITQIALMTACIAAFAQISIPMPAGVPVTMQTYIVPVAGIILGRRKGTAAAALYVLIGATGVPVFAGFAGGPGIVLGVTGGFLISFPLMAYLAGKGAEKNNSAFLYGGLISGAVINYIIGMLWFSVAAKSTLAAAFTACVLPFIPGTVIKIILAALTGRKLRETLIRARVLDA